MTIPQSDQPLFDVEVLSRKKTYKFRPFLVKEEKILVLATQSKEIMDLVGAIQQVITNCSFGEVQGDEIPIFDMQKIFMQLRAASISPVFNINYTCGFCENTQPEELDLRDFDIQKPEGHENPVKVNDKKFFVMKYPTGLDLINLSSADTLADVYSVAANCLSEIHTEEDIIYSDELPFEERVDIIDNLNLKEFEAVKKFFETMPVLERELEFTCANKECKKTSKFLMNGYLDFFV